MRCHKCAAWGCPEQVPHDLLMCKRHWYMVPTKLRKEVWATYKPGQEKDVYLVTTDYKQAMYRAIEAVRRKEFPHGNEP